jgi:hypothetical protein
MKWNEKIGSSGGWVEQYKGFEVSAQEGEKYGRKQFYIVIRKLDKEKDWFDGQLEYFKSFYEYCDSAEEAIKKGCEIVDKESYPSYHNKIKIDKTNEGYYCIDCGKFSKECKMGFGRIWVHKNNEMWYVNNHYCGCRGWD